MISFIVPIYNASNCLDRCVLSIIAQSNSDWELILINDGSIDDSGIICDKYASQDKRITVIHQSNKGVSCARNAGIAMAKGDFVAFVDSDDYITPDFIQTVQDLNNADLIITSIAWNEDNIELKDAFYDLQRDKRILPSLLKSVVMSVVWGKCYNRHIIIDNNLEFNPSINSGEDTLWLNQYLKCCSSIVCTHQICYKYVCVDNDNSLHDSKSSWSKEKIIISELIDSYQCLEDKYSISLQSIIILTLMNRFNKLYKGLCYEKWRVIYYKLSECISDGILDPLWNDKTELFKGERRQIFDRLAISRHGIILAVFVKLSKQVQY